MRHDIKHPQIISLIAAVALNGVIGIHDRLPWRLSADLRRFKQLTLHKPVIMGRTTFQSLGRPLPDRMNIVVTRSDFTTRDAVVVKSIEEANAIAQTAAANEVMVIGGASIYRQYLSLAHRFYLTEVHAEPIGDTYFPRWDRTEWREIMHENYSADEKNDYDYQFITLERK